MILNAYAVLDLFMVLVRIMLAGVIVLVGLGAWWQSRRPAPADGRTALEHRSYLLFLVAFVLLGMNIASWPLLYLVLQSYVPEWPGAMCIYGVTQVGAGSIGIARILPGLITTLQWVKPGLVFLTGAWFVLHLVNRNTQTGPLSQRLFALLTSVGLVATFDSATEAAYLLIPKKEEFLSAGCCTAILENAARPWKFVPDSITDSELRPWLSSAHYATNGGMVAVLAWAVFLARPGYLAVGLAPMLLGGLAAALLSAAFVIDIAAPVLLNLPYHHCVYDLITQVPESAVAIGLGLLGLFGVGWACVAAWCGRNRETLPYLHETLRNLLFMSLLGYAGYLGMISLELALAQ